MAETYVIMPEQDWTSTVDAIRSKTGTTSGIESSKAADAIMSIGGADWNASEGEAGYVQNRTHYEAIEMVNEPLNITWDGNTEGLVSVGDWYYKVSDLVLTDEQIKSGTLKMSDGNTTAISARWDDAVNAGQITEDAALVMGACFVRKQNASVGDRTFPEAGIYFMKPPVFPYVSSLTTTVPQPKPVVHKLDKKYLPDAVRTMDIIFNPTSAGVTADKTYDEVAEAIASGTTVRALWGGHTYLNLFHFSSDMGIAFTGVGMTEPSADAPVIFMGVIMTPSGNAFIQKVLTSS